MGQKINVLSCISSTILVATSITFSSNITNPATPVPKTAPEVFFYLKGRLNKNHLGLQVYFCFSGP